MAGIHLTVGYQSCGVRSGGRVGTPDRTTHPRSTGGYPRRAAPSSNLQLGMGHTRRLLLTNAVGFFVIHPTRSCVNISDAID